MSEFLLTQEGALRAGIFASVLALMMVIEALAPRKNRTQKRTRRWLTNAGIIVADTLIVRLVMPIVAVGVALYAAEHQIGVLNIIPLPFWVSFLLGFIFLDFAVYAQHVATHKVPLLWAFHKMHHADRDIDATTGVRFHPVEILFSMVYKMIVIMLLGPAAAAVILFEITLNASAIFNHANFRLPAILDRYMRLIIVTPDMHRVHHSIYREEHDRNYGFFLSIWDRFFKTYTAQPREGHDQMTIGLAEHQNEKPSTLLWSLLIPFRRVK